MCPPKVRTPEAPKAPPPMSGRPEATATRVKRAGSSSRSDNSTSAGVSRKRTGVNSLRVDLNVPSTAGGNGLTVPVG